MLTRNSIKGLMSTGLNMGEIAQIKTDEQANAVLELTQGENALTVKEAFDYVKGASAVSSVKTVKTGKEKLDIPVIEKTHSVLQSEVNFGGIKGAKFGEWKDRITLQNTGTGFRANSMFLVLSDYEGGKISPEMALAKIKTAQACFEEHLTVLETVKEYMVKEAVKLGLSVE